MIIFPCRIVWYGGIIKIAILVYLFPPEWLGGTEIATYNLAKHLARRGHEVHVITRLDPMLPETGTENGFLVHRIRFLTNIKLIRTGLFWMNIVILINKINPDLVHGQGIEMGCPALLSKIFFKKPYVLWSRQSIKLFSDNIPSRLRKIFLYLVSLTLRNADGVIALTNIMKKEIISICDRDIVVIPNGIDRMHGEVFSSNLRNMERHILCVSVFRREKGLKYLLGAMQIIIKNNKNIKLDLIGYGLEEQFIKREITNLHIEDYVVLHGRQPHSKISQYMQSSDVFVLPSLSEGFPNVILEAMGCGLPIVATNVGGLPEIIKNGENGFLIEPADPQSIAEKVLLILNDDTLSKRMSENNLEQSKNYHWENIVLKVEDYFCELLRDHALA